MKLSHHALQRCSQRGIRKQDIEMALLYGSRKSSPNEIFVFVCRKDLPADVCRKFGERLEGMTLIIHPQEQFIITVYKNSESLRDIKRRRHHRKIWE